MDDYDDEFDMDKETEPRIKLPKAAKVKNKMPAPVQITAEQLLREAKERELELVPPPPKQKISDPEELQLYRLKKRKEFEDNIRKNRTVMPNWIKYAAFEEAQKELQRSRSVYERALDVDHRCIPVWLKYAEMEMRARQINHARNIWDRAVTVLPRANQFWYKYSYMEEMLGNIQGARQVFERWMEWQPEEQAWHSFINMELRYKELDRARKLYERFVLVHTEVKNWIKYAKFEEKNGYLSSARKIYERAVEFFGEQNLDPDLLVEFAKFEERQKEHERARVIYKYGLDHLPKEKCELIYKYYTIHEKKFGDREAIEDVIVSKRRHQYEEEVKTNPTNYDAWFDYLRLLEGEDDHEQTREMYERAIANLPPSHEKRYWRRYIYLWINYALFEELIARDFERTREVYKACLDLIPHKKFTFAKIWLFFAQFEIRRKNLMQARKILGTALGKCPKDKLFRGYIDLEIQLKEFDRCRILYGKFLEFNLENCTTWTRYAELESELFDPERARAIFELAVAQQRLDMPELLWKAYIDFELNAEKMEYEEGELTVQPDYKRTRQLYRRLLERTQHVKVWLAFAKFESASGLLSNARDVYREASLALRSCEERAERHMLLEEWMDFEMENGTSEDIEYVQSLQPKKVKKRRRIQTADGSEAGWEEYYDYIFPDDQTSQPNLKLLAMAKRWKQQRTEEYNNSEEVEAGDVNDHDESAARMDQDSDSNSSSVKSGSENCKGPGCSHTHTEMSDR